MINSVKLNSISQNYGEVHALININLEIKDFIKKNNIKFPVLGKPIRYLLTNSFNGPSITDIFMILGKDQSLERLKRYKN